jgi:adhesin transport system outer membrane protein
VQARYHQLQASESETRAAFGQYLPKLDLSAQMGQEYRERPDYLQPRDFDRDGYSLQLTQSIFRGFAVQGDHERAGFVSRGRYHELRGISEELALETARAYLNVQRYREFVALAQTNYDNHKALFERLQKRAAAGVSRSVDLEQATGRLALAQANLITEKANLNDVESRFLRLVGESAAAELRPVPQLQSALPPTAALADWAGKAPVTQSALAFLEASKKAVTVAKATRYPQLELRARKELGSDLDGIPGDYDTEVVELVLNYNLYNGGSDEAKVAQRVSEADEARDLRDQACRDLGQTVSVARNDFAKLGEQKAYLAQHEASTTKVRDAYFQQFDLGQRSLLDLLDTENELFQSRRALAGAQYDWQISSARVLSAFGQLLPALQINGLASQVDADLTGYFPAPAMDFCVRER